MSDEYPVKSEKQDSALQMGWVRSWVKEPELRSKKLRLKESESGVWMKLERDVTKTGGGLGFRPHAPLDTVGLLQKTILCLQSDISGPAGARITQFIISHVARSIVHRGHQRRTGAVSIGGHIGLALERPSKNDDEIKVVALPPSY
ncbi:hypothetical protein FB45DRAFT_869124 [Roridomyces roridus]|uniref:Uncharacterized protein n=1 Tax=Roridomyces roridus TaxID=1738132 RepID=A0AAD7BNH9_9AGAR|nr:hypothetical protein FB45DRAFT_869124 [Roridomyces roridus]